MFFARKLPRKPETRRLASKLADMLRDFQPGAVVYVARGGREIGEIVSAELGLPLVGMDIRYPFSRLWDRVPLPVRAVMFPTKEIAYRLTRPSRAEPRQDLPPPGTRVALVDDTASSGKTLEAAFATLARGGIPQDTIIVGVLRCGKNARNLVDRYLLD